MKTAEQAEDQVWKGRHARSQLQIWDSLVEMRIRLQVRQLGAD
jgi:hypothetical protein